MLWISKWSRYWHSCACWRKWLSVNLVCNLRNKCWRNRREQTHLLIQAFAPRTNAITYFPLTHETKYFCISNQPLYTFFNCYLVQICRWLYRGWYAYTLCQPLPNDTNDTFTSICWNLSVKGMVLLICWLDRLNGFPTSWRVIFRRGSKTRDWQRCHEFFLDLLVKEALKYYESTTANRGCWLIRMTRPSPTERQQWVGHRSIMVSSSPQQIVFDDEPPAAGSWRRSAGGSCTSSSSTTPLALLI